MIEFKIMKEVGVWMKKMRWLMDKFVLNICEVVKKKCLI